MPCKGLAVIDPEVLQISGLRRVLEPPEQDDIVLNVTIHYKAVLHMLS